MRHYQQPGDLLVASIHWGSNWGYDIPPKQIAFAYRLIEEGVTIVHGHSSHHVKAIEVFKGCLILYGCGDFLTDYEGIGGYEEFRSDLALMYIIELDSSRGAFDDFDPADETPACSTDKMSVLRISASWEARDEFS